jgi:hypothetical protein
MNCIECAANDGNRLSYPKGVKLKGVKSALILLLLGFSPWGLGEPLMQIDKKDETKDLPAIETVAADPRAKIIEELGQDLDEAQTIGLVLDSSGSMGQMLEKNKTKMFYMKKLMKGFISKQWKLKNTLGVRVYGSRKKHQCDDIQLTIPYTDRALSKLELSLEKMEPLG